MMGKDKDYLAAQSLSLETGTRKHREKVRQYDRSQETELKYQQTISSHQLCGMIKSGVSSAIKTGNKDNKDMKQNIFCTTQIWGIGKAL